MKNKNGVSLITLIVTIMVMLILIGVVGTYSLENIKKAGEAVTLREFSNIRDFVIDRQVKLDNEEVQEALSSYSDLILSAELAYIVSDGMLSEDELNNIIDVNSSDLKPQYKYYFIQADGKYFEDPKFVAGGSSVKDVKNDYIINFYSGTVICLNKDNFKIEGLVKGLLEIMNEI